MADQPGSPGSSPRPGGNRRRRRRRGSGSGPGTGQGTGRQGGGSGGQERQGQRQGQGQRPGQGQRQRQGQRQGQQGARQGGGAPANRRRRLPTTVEVPPVAAPAPVAHGVQVLDRAVDDPTAAVAPNRRRAFAVVACPAVVVIGLGVVLGLAAGDVLLGVLIGAVVGVAGALVVWRGAEAALLRAVDARSVDEDDVPGPATLVEGLCASMGLGQPDLYLVDDELPNALAVGRSPRHAALVLTTGLLSRLDPVELEGVLAHELAHVKRNDVAPATMAAALLLAAVVVPGGSGIVHRVAGRGREFATDRQAVRVTRYPPGLRQALAALSEPSAGHSALSAGRAGQITRWLWTVVLPDQTGRRPAGDELVGELDAPGVRVGALDEW